MRLIDANALYKTLEQIRMDYIDEESMSSDFAAQVIELVQDEYLAKAPTIDPARLRPQWIPVTERLPEKYEDVLITYRIPNEKAARIWFGYRVETGWCAYGVDRPNPTAWMPLPEPYEPDGAKMDGGVYDGTGS